MTIEKIINYKGTQLVGKLEHDVKIGEKYTIGEHPNKILVGILENKINGNFKEFALTNEQVILLFRSKPGEDLADIKIGDEIND